MCACAASPAATQHICVAWGRPVCKSGLSKPKAHELFWAHGCKATSLGSLEELERAPHWTADFSGRTLHSVEARDTSPAHSSDDASAYALCEGQGGCAHASDGASAYALCEGRGGCAHTPDGASWAHALPVLPMQVLQSCLTVPDTRTRACTLARACEVVCACVCVLLHARARTRTHMHALVHHYTRMRLILRCTHPNNSPLCRLCKWSRSCKRRGSVSPTARTQTCRWGARRTRPCLRPLGSSVRLRASNLWTTCSWRKRCAWWTSMRVRTEGRARRQDRPSGLWSG